MILFLVFLTVLLPVLFSQDLAPQPAVTISVVPDYNNNNFSLTCHPKNVEFHQAEPIENHKLISYFFIPDNDQMKKIELAYWEYTSSTTEPEPVKKTSDTLQFNFNLNQKIDLKSIGIQEINSGASNETDLEANFIHIENNFKSKGTYYCKLMPKSEPPKAYISRLWSAKLTIPIPSALLTTTPSNVNKIDDPFTATCWLGNFDQNEIISTYAIYYYSDDRIIGSYDTSFQGSEVASKFTVSKELPSTLSIIGTAAVFPRFDAVIRFENTEANSSTFQCAVKIDDGEEKKSNIYTHKIDEKEDNHNQQTGGSFYLVPSITGITFAFIFQKFTV